MKDKDKTKGQLVSELEEMRQRIAEMEASEVGRERSGEDSQKSDGVYQRLLELLPIGVTMLDMKGIVLYCNPAVYSKGGYPEGEFTGKHFSKIASLRIKDIPRFISVFNSIVRGKIPKPFEAVYQRKNGTTGWTELHIGLIKIGGKRRILVAQHDITERKALDENLEGERQELNLIIESSPIIVFYKDRKGRFVRVNKAFAEALQMPEKEFVGKTVFDLYSTNIAQDMTNDDQEVFQSGHPKLGIIEKYESASGIKWVQTDKIPIYNRDGSPTGLIGFAQDITEQKRIEEEFQDFFSLSPDMMGIFTTEGALVKVNDSWERTLGYKTEELLKMDWTSLVHPDDAESTNKEVEKQLKGSTVANFTNRYRCKDGSYKTLEWQATFAKESIVYATARDITERKKVEEALLEANQFSENLIATMADGFSVLDTNGIHIDVNPALCRMTGFSSNELIGVGSPHPYWPPENYAKIEEAFQETLQSESNEYELVFMKKNGERFPVSVSPATITDAHGNVIGYSATVKDITERKQTEEALRLSSTQWQSTFDAISDATCVLNAEGKIQRCNDAMSQLVSKPLSDMIGHTCCEFIHGSPKHLEGCPWESAQSSRSRERAELAVGGKWLEVTVDPILDSDHKLVGAVHVVSDITKRKQMEEDLRKEKELLTAVMENTGAMLVYLDTDFNFIWVNDAYAKTCGYRVEEMIGKNHFDLYPHEENQAIFARVRDTGRPETYYSKSFTFPDQPERGVTYWDWTLVSVKDVQDNVNGLIFSLVETTKHVMLEEEQQKVAKLESIGTLAGGIAHDFNNILTGIIGNISLAIRQVEPDSKAADRLLEAEKASMRAKDLTQQLLTFSTGGAPIKKVISIADIIKGSATFALRGSNTRCEYSLPDDLWPVEADEGQLNQVIANLAINADQAMPEGGIINIKAKNTAIERGGHLPLPNGNYVELAIEDHGVGIPKEHLDRIFDPYFTTKQKGSGLGLAVTFSIIKNHNGYITVESEMGVGATAHVYLPASRRPAPVKEEAMVETAIPGKGRILVMDDEEVIRQLVSRTLADAGYEVEVSKDGKEAIDKYTEAIASGQPFAAVILDLTVPGGMGGEETMKKLLEIYPDVKAIVSSGYSTDPIMADYKKYGFSGVVAKPYKAGEMEKTLRKVMTETGEQ